MFGQHPKWIYGKFEDDIHGIIVGNFHKKIVPLVIWQSFKPIIWEYWWPSFHVGSLQSTSSKIINYMLQLETEHKAKDSQLQPYPFSKI